MAGFSIASIGICIGSTYLWRPQNLRLMLHRNKFMMRMRSSRTEAMMMLKSVVFLIFLAGLPISAAHATFYVDEQIDAGAAKFSTHEKSDPLSEDSGAWPGIAGTKFRSISAQPPKIPQIFSSANQMREPGTWIMMIVGFATIGCALRRNASSGII